MPILSFNILIASTIISITSDIFNIKATEKIDDVLSTIRLNKADMRKPVTFVNDKGEDSRMNNASIGKTMPRIGKTTQIIILKVFVWDELVSAACCFTAGLASLRITLTCQIPTIIAVIVGMIMAAIAIHSAIFSWFILKSFHRAG
jgi:hypothetical protein